MIFSSKKKDGEQENLNLEENMNQFQELLRNALNEKAELHSLLASMQNERLQTQSDRQSVEDLKNNIELLRTDYSTAKSDIAEIASGVVKVSEAISETALLESRMKRMEEMLLHLTQNENYVEQLTIKVDEVMKRLEDGESGSLRKNLESVDEIETRQKKLHHSAGAKIPV